MEDLQTDSKSKYAPHIALVAVQLMFGTFPVVGKIALASFPSFGLVAFRVGGAALAFFALQRFSGNIRLKERKDYFLMAGYAVLGVILNQLLSVTGLSLTTASNSALLAVMMPVFVAIISRIFGYDRLSKSKILGILIAASGVIYLINPLEASFSADHVRGDLMIVANGFCYAAYLAISRDTIARNGALRSLVWLFLFGSIVCVPVGAWSMLNFDFSLVPNSAWLALGFIIAFPTIGAYYLNAWALARVEPSVVAVYIYLQPLIGFLLAVIFLGEKVNPKVIVAGLLIFAGVFLVTKKFASR
jgi:drug/metabolite transporter (DMT)-like permease